jgi:hypothetical protein
MFTVTEILQLKLYGLFEAGVPNRERIVMRAWELGSVNLAPYFLTMGVKIPDTKGATPTFDSVLWLGEYEVQANQWVIVYSGPGSSRAAQTESGEPMHVLHWNRPKVLGAPGVVPVLIQAGGIAVDFSHNWAEENAQAQARLGGPKKAV